MPSTTMTGLLTTEGININVAFDQNTELVIYKSINKQFRTNICHRARQLLQVIYMRIFTTITIIKLHHDHLIVGIILVR